MGKTCMLYDYRIIIAESDNGDLTALLYHGGNLVASSRPVGRYYLRDENERCVVAMLLRHNSDQIAAELLGVSTSD